MKKITVITALFFMHIFKTQAQDMQVGDTIVSMAGKASGEISTREIKSDPALHVNIKFYEIKSSRLIVLAPHKDPVKFEIAGSKLSGEIMAALAEWPAGTRLSFDKITASSKTATFKTKPVTFILSK